jgi:hypothetical protein
MAAFPTPSITMPLDDTGPLDDAGPLEVLSSIAGWSDVTEGLFRVRVEKKDFLGFGATTTGSDVPPTHPSRLRVSFSSSSSCWFISEGFDLLKDLKNLEKDSLFWRHFEGFGSSVVVTGAEDDDIDVLLTHWEPRPDMCFFIIPCEAGERMGRGVKEGEESRRERNQGGRGIKEEEESNDTPDSNRARQEREWGD